MMDKNVSASHQPLYEVKKMTINICGIPYTVIDLDDNFSADAKHFGQTDFLKARIILNEYLAEPIKQETLIHEIVHAILVHIGRPDLSEDETFVQSFANAINQTFELKKQEVAKEQLT